MEIYELDSHMCATIPLHRSLDGALLGVLWNIFLHIYSLCAFEGNTFKRKQETTQVNLTLQVSITFLLGFQRTVETIVFPLFILCSPISYSLQSCWASCTERTLDTWLKKGILLMVQVLSAIFILYFSYIYEME